MKEEHCPKPHTYMINVIDVGQEIDFSKNPNITLKNYITLSEREGDTKCHIKEIESDEKSEKPDEGVDFETAIKATEYGKFNWFVLFAALWANMSCTYSVAAISMILPSAECDLNLSNFDKGILNSSVFISMTISTFFWGLLSDVLGRKKVLLFLYITDAILSIIVGLSQSFTVLVISKFCSGFISSGPLGILSSYLAENHSGAYRGSVVLFSGMFLSFATILLPLQAWLIIPQSIRLVLFNGYIVLPSWRIFLLISAIPSTLASITLFYLDETPKFLMSQGKNNEALKVLQRMYHMNTGKPKETFPVKTLRNEMKDDQNEIRKGNVCTLRIINIGWKQIVPLFQKPYISIGLLPGIIQFCVFSVAFTVMLWAPQLYALVINMEKHAYNTTGSTICQFLVPKPNTDLVRETIDCSEHRVEDQVYFNSMITGLVCAIGYLISGYVVKILDKKWLMTVQYIIGFSCWIALYWSTSSYYMVGMISVYIAVIWASSMAIIVVVSDIFPTSLRTTAVSMNITIGRVGAMIGNLAFPLLLDWKCSAPFFVFGALIALPFVLTLLLPRTKGKDLQ